MYWVRSEVSKPKKGKRRKRKRRREEEGQQMGRKKRRRKRKNIWPPTFYSLLGTIYMQK